VANKTFRFSFFSPFPVCFPAFFKGFNQMARPRLADTHHELVGSKYRNRAKTESKLSAASPKMPSHLGTEARREWKRISPMLLQRGSLTEGDATALALYAETFARWCAAKKEIVERGLTIETTVLDKQGAAVSSRKVNPALKIAENCERSLRSFLRELGLTPATRERVLPAKPAEEKTQSILSQMRDKS
jgi:P27 family predicted phage terminase small subunit